MGQQYSHPQPGVRLKVIGPGLSRTGTASFSRALEILLDAPVYHGGTQAILGPESEIKAWLELLSQWPPQSPSAAAKSMAILRRITEGYAAITDAPSYGLVQELMTLYPDAKVICTVRDVESWEKSMDTIQSVMDFKFLRLALFLVPTSRLVPAFLQGLDRQWNHLFQNIPFPIRNHYNHHIKWLRENVPKERLVFFNVKDGWEPLCQVLDLPVPEGIPFPRINDSKAISDLTQREVRRGLQRWAFIIIIILGIILFYLRG
ncbi:hypothetical protein S40285_08643 [Stachybotrys chlorohalonatus IBT 40285]|uniref:NAD dependent epimerase/dehydratase n=1 Tax=Stachybotrys chlorohalonatus (strain IBT 40285) TaxID=1283841 RepID=A0A084QTJ5_STAC4|nr:hypothetical protein S40285_08643 [Stachybotrys chlorohalonata IBT 40285]